MAGEDDVSDGGRTGDAPVSAAEKQARGAIFAGAAVSLVGVGTLGAAPAAWGRLAGGVALVVGWSLLVAGLHRFGRVGRDPL